MVTPDRPSVGASFGDLAHDITVLVELQVKLAALDIKESVGRLILPVALAVLGVCAILGCFPVLMIAAAYGIHAAGLAFHWAFLIAGGGGLLVGLGLLGLSWLLLRNAFGVLDRSREALAENIRWLRDTLKRQRTKSDDAASPN